MNIQLIDLKKQYESIKTEIHAAALGVLDSGSYILGPDVQRFENEIAEYCGTKYAIGVANGTDALLLTLDALGIGPGDEVITTPFTFLRRRKWSRRWEQLQSSSTLIRKLIIWTFRRLSKPLRRKRRRLFLYIFSGSLQTWMRFCQ